MAFNVHKIPGVVGIWATLYFWMKHGFQRTYSCTAFPRISLQ
uniref:Uncharacterized protein n=1 Tax=Arundo donax TaxID=35708 RepID=A0A0A9FVE3_ARUDO